MVEMGGGRAGAIMNRLLKNSAPAGAVQHLPNVAIIPCGMLLAPAWDILNSTSIMV